MKIHAISLLVLALGACSPAADAPAKPEAAAAKPVKTAHGFDIQLTLTPRTADKLAAMGEQVTISAYFFGEPKPGIDLGDEGVGGVDLGEDQIDVAPENALVVVTGAGFDPTHIADVEGAPQVLVNVYTARKAHGDNLIGCGIYQGPITMAQDKPVAITCDLLEPPAPVPA